MADKPTKSGGIGDISINASSNAGDDRQARKTADAVKQESTAWTQNTQALRTNASAREKWARTSKEQETWLSKLQKGVEDWTGGLFRAKNQLDDIKGSMSKFGRDLSQMSSLSGIYARKLAAMRDGQKAFTGSLVATTGATAHAMEKSQQYVNAIEKSRIGAHKMASEFKVDVKAMEGAINDLNARFATQIAASGDMEGALNGMRREAFILSRAMGMEMTDVMDTWNERLQQSIGTLEDARAEMISVAKSADDYAKEIKSLGDQYLKTGNIGKREFVEMVRSVGKELRTGTINAAGYARALKGLLAESKKGLRTTEEQRLAAEGTKKMLASMFTTSGEGAVFGMKAAKQVIAQWDDLSHIQNEGLRKRLEMVRTEFKDSPEIDQIRAVMDVLRGSAAGNAEIARMTSSMMSTTMMRNFAAKFTEGNILVANTVAKQFKSGEMAANFEKEAAKDSKEQRDGQVKVWKKSFEDMIKAAHTPKDLEYKMIAMVEEIKNDLAWIVKYFPMLAVGGQLVGAIAGKVGGMVLKGMAARVGAGAAAKTLAGTAASTGFKVLPAAAAAKMGLVGGGGAASTIGGGGAATAATGGLGAAAGSAAAAFFGPVFAGAAGAAFGHYVIDKGVGSQLYKLASEETQRIVGDDKTISGLIGAEALKEGGGPWGNAEGAKMIMEEITRMRGGEYAKRKDMVKQLDKQIKKMKAYDHDLTEVQKAELRALERKKAQLEESTKRRKQQDEKEKKVLDVNTKVGLRDTMRTRLAMLKGGSQDKLASDLVGGNIGAKDFKLEHLATGQFAQELVEQIQAMPEAQRKKYGNVQEFAAKAERKSMETYLARVSRHTSEDLKGMSRDELNKAFTESTGMKVQKATAIDPETARAMAAGAAVRLQVSAETSGDGKESEMKVNAKGQWVIPMPGYKLVLNGEKMAAANAQSTVKNTAG